MQFFELPHEAIIKIFSYLDPTDLAAINSTCKALQNLYPDKDLWRSLFKKDFGFAPEEEAGASCLQKYMVAYLFKKGKDAYEAGDIGFAKQCFTNAKTILDSFPKKFSSVPGEQPIPWTKNTERNQQDKGWLNLCLGWYESTVVEDEDISSDIMKDLFLMPPPPLYAEGTKGLIYAENKIPKLVNAIHLLRESPCPLAAIAILKPCGLLMYCINFLKELTGLQNITLVRNTSYPLAPLVPNDEIAHRALSLINHLTQVFDFDEDEFRKESQEKFDAAKEAELKTGNDFIRFMSGVDFAIQADLLAEDSIERIQFINLLERASESSPAALVLLGYCYCIPSTRGIATSDSELGFYRDVSMQVLLNFGITPQRLFNMHVLKIVSQNIDKARAYFQAALDKGYPAAIMGWLQLDPVAIANWNAGNIDEKNAWRKNFATLYLAEMTLLANKTQDPLLAFRLSQLYGDKSDTSNKVPPPFHGFDFPSIVEQAEYWLQRSQQWLYQQVEHAHTIHLSYLVHNFLMDERALLTDIKKTFDILTIAEEKGDPRAARRKQTFFDDLFGLESLLRVLEADSPLSSGMTRRCAYAYKIIQKHFSSLPHFPVVRDIWKGCRLDRLTEDDTIAGYELRVIKETTKKLIEEFKNSFQTPHAPASNPPSM